MKNEVAYVASIGNTIKSREILSEIISSFDNKGVSLEGEYLLNLNLMMKRVYRKYI